MSERKVLNKYYPPDFDPSKIPRAKRDHNKTFTVRLMAPFNMRCTTCGEYIYKGRKFNARKEDVENEDFLGLRIYRFYIKCTRCLSEISFKTDPQSTDYVIETGATRNFMALKLAEEQAAREEEARKEEEASNPMKMLENRTKQSREEIEAIEALEELREMNKRQQTLNYESMLNSYELTRQQEHQKAILKAEQDDEELIKKYFGANHDGTKVKRIVEDDEPKQKVQKLELKKPALPSVVKPTLGIVKKPALLGVVKKKEVKEHSEPSKQTASESMHIKVKVNDSDKEVISSDENQSSGPLPKLTLSSSGISANLEEKSGEKLSVMTTNILCSMSSSFEYSQKSGVEAGGSKSKVKATGLSLLGAYSDSGSDSD